MIVTQDHLGIGVYSPSEAAFYARVPTRKLSRWVFGGSAGKPVINRQLSDPDDKIVTFLDFIQALAIREVRVRHEIPLQRIREGVDEARNRYDLRYPLACRHRIFLFSDQKKKGHGQIVIRLEGDDEDVEHRYVQLTGRDKGSYLLQQIVEMFLDDLTFDPHTKLATQYRPMTEDKISVLLDPHQRFGEPLIETCGYTAEALWHATNTEGGLDEAASAYGVSREEVALANKYYDSLLYYDNLLADEAA